MPGPSATLPAAVDPKARASGARDTSGRGALLVATGILLSRILGLVRERVFAHYFGSSVAAAAFRAAQRIPNFLQNLLGEGVLSASFIPVYAELPEMSRERGTPEEVAKAMRGRLDRGSARIAFFVLPSAAALLVLGDVVGGTLLQTGRFTSGTCATSGTC